MARPKSQKRVQFLTDGRCGNRVSSSVKADWVAASVAIEVVLGVKSWLQVNRWLLLQLSGADSQLLAKLPEPIKAGVRRAKADGE